MWYNEGSRIQGRRNFKALNMSCIGKRENLREKKETPDMNTYLVLLDLTAFTAFLYDSEICHIFQMAL